MEIKEMVNGKEIEVLVVAHTYLTIEGKKRTMIFLEPMENMWMYMDWSGLNEEQTELFNTHRDSLLRFLKEPESLKKFMNGETFGLGFDMDKEYKLA